MKIMLLVLLGLVAAVVTAMLYGDARWKSGTRALRERLEAGRLPVEPTLFDQAELNGLPAPVQRFFRAALNNGTPIVSAVDMEHSGRFNLGEDADNWKPFTSTQRVVTRRPGFDWDGRIAIMPGVSVRVHDAYVAGEGILHAAIFGLVSMVNLRDTGDLAEGELMRFFAEAAWYPTALLPSQGVEWEAVNDESARATMSDGEITSTLLIHFGTDGLIDVVSAEARGRMVGETTVPTPWQGRFWNYAPRDGMQVPMEGEVAWVLPVGIKPYWRGKLTSLRYQ